MALNIAAASALKYLLQSVATAFISYAGNRMSQNESNDINISNYLAYSSPGAMRQQMEGAGLSPAAIAQSISGAPPTGGTIIQDTRSPFDLTGAIDSIAGLGSLENETRLNEAQIDKIDAEAKEISSRRQLNENENEVFQASKEWLKKLPKKEFEKLEQEVKNLKQAHEKGETEKEILKRKNEFEKEHSDMPTEVMTGMFGMFRGSKLGNAIGDLMDFIGNVFVEEPENKPLNNPFRHD